MKAWTHVIKLALLMLVAIFSSPTARSSEACPATVPAVTRALCEHPGLQQLLDELARRSARLQQQCSVVVPRDGINPQPHAAWLASVQEGFNHLRDIAAQDYLGSAFTQRADELNEALASCARDPRLAAQKLHITTIPLPSVVGKKPADTMLYVETEPKLVGQRINDELFWNLFGVVAPPSPRNEEVRKALSMATVETREDGRPMNSTLNVSVLWRTAHLLLLQVDTSGCEARCWQDSEQQLFDLRTGEQVNPEDLLSAQGWSAFDRFSAHSILQNAHAFRQRNNVYWQPDGRDSFDSCIRDWQTTHLIGGSRITWLSHGRWHVPGPECTGDDDAMPPAIFSKTFPVSTLEPYLSDYGKSLLLDRGDVRAPDTLATTCPAPLRPPDPLHWADRVADISAGSRQTFLRESSGRVWGWGWDAYGELGKGGKGGGAIFWPPFIFGDGLKYAGAGQEFSAILSDDGGLSTWGNGYMEHLGDGVQSRLRPVAIGQHYVWADVDNYGGRALSSDGRLWAWGGKPLRVIADNVIAAARGYPVLMLRRDNGLWIWPGSARPGQTAQVLQWLGTGYEHLPQSRGMALAWRADGTVWAWGSTLSKITAPDELPGLAQNPWPRLVGQNWADAKAADRGALVAVRKTDGSLWVTKNRGAHMHLEPVGCGFADMAFAYDEVDGVHLLALRSDGAVLDFHERHHDGINGSRDLLDFNPEVVAKDGVRLFQENDYGGNVGAKVFLLSRDGTLRQWFWNSWLPHAEGDVPPEQRFIIISFPDAWFQRQQAH